MSMPKKSRQIQNDTEWTLNKKKFLSLCNTLFCPCVDIIASRTNAQLEKYISWNLLQ
jgi:hypothetical protein